MLGAKVFRTRCHKFTPLLKLSNMKLCNRQSLKWKNWNRALFDKHFEKIQISYADVAKATFTRYRINFLRFKNYCVKVFLFAHLHRNLNSKTNC